ncbi:MAG: hypothetical protein JWN62_925 [Acidimicrobiales bacterium]|nr:hypothetical protein [Acidimicrobiales bacterium]
MFPTARRPRRSAVHYDLLFVERGEWEDDPEYPNAPLPAHERTWRHPSEQGATQWVRSEPPLVVGRGLSVATGTVGAVLAVGLLWLMIPNDNKGGGVAVQGSTTVRVAAESLTSRPTSSLPASAPAELSSAPITSLAATSTAPPPTDGTTTSPPTSPDTSDPTSASSPADSTPPSSAATLVDSSLPSSTGETAPPVETIHPALALAVSVGSSHYVAATAAAVGDQSTMTVQLPSGDSTTASVVSVDSSTGIAVLAIPDDVDAAPMEASHAALPTDAAIVLTPDPMPVSVWRDDTGTNLTSDPEVSVPEGSLVLDTDNRLIGMCTTTANGIHVLDAVALRDAINAVIARQSQAWGGFQVAVADNGDLTVTGVAAGSPAATAGVQVGSLIRGIDGAAIQGPDGLEALRATLRSHVPGDTVTLSVVAPGATDPADVAVTLVANPGSF